MKIRAKPTKQKLKEGNLGRRALNVDEPEHSEDQLVPPGYLGKRAKEVFLELARRMSEMGYGSATYTETVAGAAIAQVMVEECQKEVSKHGVSYTHVAKSGDILRRQRPEVKTLEGAMKQLRGFLSELGLTPVSKTRVVSPKAVRKVIPQTSGSVFSSLKTKMVGGVGGSRTKH